MQSGRGLYVHIPYCPAKCWYCDFNSHAGGAPEQGAQYVAALRREMAYQAARPELAAGAFTTLFVGGGTPTVLPAPLLAEVIAAALAAFRFIADVEVSIEANPGTVDVAADKLGAARRAGANRISFGVQAFQDRLLQRLGRVHRAADIGTAVALARRAGFANINLDLIFGLPGQTLADWDETLQRALQLEPDHLSCYSLSVEEGTLYHRERLAGRLDLPTEEVEEAMYDHTRQILAAAGFVHYEVSAYARPGRRCRHNLIYWQNGEYLGLGAGAHSYLAGRRFWNRAAPAAYIQAVAAGGCAEEDGETLDLPGQMAETMILGLRTTDGVGLRRFSERFGRSALEVFGSAAGELQRCGLLQMTPEAWRLTEQGMKVGNRVWQAFLP